MLGLVSMMEPPMALMLIFFSELLLLALLALLLSLPRLVFRVGCKVRLSFPLVMTAIAMIDDILLQLELSLGRLFLHLFFMLHEAVLVVGHQTWAGLLFSTCRLLLLFWLGRGLGFSRFAGFSKIVLR